MLHFVSHHSLKGAVLVPSDTRQQYSIVDTASGYEPETLHIVGNVGSAPRRPRYMVVHKSCAFGVVRYVVEGKLRLLLPLHYSCTTTVVDVLYRYTLSFYRSILPILPLLYPCAQVCCRRYYLQQYTSYESFRGDAGTFEF